MDIAYSLELCGERITHYSLLYKTYSTFHPNDVLLLHTAKKFTTYNDLLSYLLASEQKKQKIKDTINRFDKLQKRYIELKNNEMRPPIADEAEVELHMATHALWKPYYIIVFWHSHFHVSWVYVSWIALILCFIHDFINKMNCFEFMMIICCLMRNYIYMPLLCQDKYDLRINTPTHFSKEFKEAFDKWHDMLCHPGSVIKYSWTQLDIPWKKGKEARPRIYLNGIIFTL